MHMACGSSKAGARRTWRCVLAGTVFLFVAGTMAAGAAATHLPSITDTSLDLPTREQLIRVLSLRDHNTRVVIIGTFLLGLAAGIIGTFMLLRKRALMGDAASHATLPGIGCAFIFMAAMGGDGKYLPGLLLGALISGMAGMGFILLIRNLTRLKEDAALGIVLSVFFGLGIALLGVIQKMSVGHAAGLESFIYGMTASMLTSDAVLIASAAVVVTICCTALYKEFTLLCFDQDFAGAQGWPVLLLDTIHMILVVGVTVIGLQAVGLILMVALLIIPPSAARFWTHRLHVMVFISAAIGGVSGLLGAGLSAFVPRLPAGAVIVLVASIMFVFSMFLGPARGVLFRVVEHIRFSRKIARQHLLRALYEWVEKAEKRRPMGQALPGMTLAQLVAERSWTQAGVKRLLHKAVKDGLVREDAHGGYHLTASGLAKAKRLVRNHRLWEMYLITHADIAPSHVDRDADELEHVLGRDMVAKLERLLDREHPELAVPPSPHTLARRTAG